MRLIWSPRAVDALADAVRYIATENPGAATRWAEGLLEARGHLILECNSRERGEQGKQLVEGLLAGLCEPGVMSLEEIDPTRRSHDDRGAVRSPGAQPTAESKHAPPGDVEPRAEEPARELVFGSTPLGSYPAPLTEQERRQLELELKASHYDNWPDRKIPALDDKTPRQAARSASGRAKLVALLKGWKTTSFTPQGAVARRPTISPGCGWSWGWKATGRGGHTAPSCSQHREVGAAEIAPARNHATRGHSGSCSSAQRAPDPALPTHLPSATLS